MTTPIDYNSNWRKVASTIYKKPTDSKIFGIVELDVTELEKYVAQKRKEGVKTTLTYLITLIIGRGIRQDVPELNTYVKRGRIVQRKQVDATVSVLLPGGQMGSVKVENADQITTAEISEVIGKNIANSRKGNENDTMTGFASLLPSSNISFVFVLGTVNKKPVVVNDEIVIRRVMLMSSTLDHRVVDGSHGGTLFRFIKQIAKNPEILDSKPDPSKSLF